MATRYFGVLALFVLLVAVVSSAHAVVPTYSGSLSSPAANGLDGSGNWIEEGASISWNVYQYDTFWRYEYTLNIPSDVSHFILEASPTFGYDDIWNLQVYNGSIGGIEIETYNAPPPGNPGAQPNPYMPDDIYGIKFDDTSGETLKFSFDSLRIPVWGDFYAKGGNAGGSPNAVWNNGFLTADPEDPYGNGSLEDHILRPDTKTTVIPEPSSIALGAMGLGGLLANRRRFVRK